MQPLVYVVRSLSQKECKHGMFAIKRTLGDAVTYATNKARYMKKRMYVTPMTMDDVVRKRK